MMLATTTAINKRDGTETINVSLMADSSSVKHHGITKIYITRIIAKSSVHMFKEMF